MSSAHGRALSLVPSPVSKPDANAKPPAEGVSSDIPLLRETPLDSLAYLDDEAEIAAARPEVEALVAAEAAAGTRKPSAYRAMITGPASKTFSSMPVSALAVDNVNRVDISRYEDMPQVPPAGSDPEEWRKVLDRVTAKVGVDNLTLVNAGLLERFGPALWKVSIEDVEVSVARAKESLQAVKKQIARVNAKRKADQLRVGTRLAKLQREYRATVSKNAAIRAALVKIAAEKRTE